MVELKFALLVEDNWPPVSVEVLHGTLIENGFRIEDPPFFVKNMSVGDVISIDKDDFGNIVNWQHISESGNTTIWLMQNEEFEELDLIMSKLRLLGCHTVRLQQFDYYAVDVPASCEMKNVDAILEGLEESKISIAFPSFRH